MKTPEETKHTQMGRLEEAKQLNEKANYFYSKTLKIDISDNEKGQAEDLIKRLNQMCKKSYPVAIGVQPEEKKLAMGLQTENGKGPVPLPDGTIDGLAGSLNIAKTVLSNMIQEEYDTNPKNAQKIYKEMDDIYRKATRDGKKLTGEEHERFRYLIFCIHNACGKDPELVKSLEKENKLILTINGRYSGATFQMYLYWANIEDRDNDVKKLIREDLAVVELLQERKYHTRSPEMRKKAQEMRVVQMEENADNIHTREFYNKGIVSYIVVQAEAERRGLDNVPIIAAGKRNAELRSKTEMARLDLALAMLKSERVRSILYPHMQEIVWGDQESEEWKKIVRQGKVKIDKRISQILNKLNDKQQEWLEMRKTLIDSTKRPGSVSLELIKKSNDEVKLFFKELKEIKGNVADDVESLLLAKNALNMLA